MKLHTLVPPQGWGSRSQLEATMKDLADVRGNRDGLWDNEGKAAGKTSGFLAGQPLVEKFQNFLGAGLRTKDEVGTLQSFRATKEREWGQPVTQLDLGQLRNGELFAAQKAIALERMGRHPSEVTEGFVQAAGRVNGEEIAPRDVFWQRFKPTAPPSGKVVVLSPGFQETGRNFYEQIQKMNALGHDVIVMDHQWAGQTDGVPGGLDRGFGVARDVAAVAAHANQVAQQEYGDRGEIVLFGNSMGAGPGVLGALLMNDNDKIQLDGPQMPKGVKAVLQAPFLRATPSVTNDALDLASKLPFLNKISAPSAGVPVINSDKIGSAKGAQSAVLEDVRAQLRSMTAAEDDLSTMMSMMEQGLRPQGQLFVVHGDRDTLADSAASVALKERLGDQVELQVLHTTNHVLEQNPGQQDHAIQGLQRLLDR
ncbi:MAG: alpha/beta fold hydrolase [Myxococcales bacterium]|nr:alpha/beta fold hydrolase [Myxococcales bacterium]